ncbi:MAG: LuxR C-terminal-related transcriptional regulator [Chryseolinea sp.]
MKLKVIVYGLSLASLVFVLKILQYRYVVHDLSIEFYAGIVALLFVVLGVWVGSRLTQRKTAVVQTSSALSFKVDEERLRQVGLSRREFEVLELMSMGNSNNEIAEKLFVSTNTVKSHAANLFLKLDVKRRTQAVRKAQELSILP